MNGIIEHMVKVFYSPYYTLVVTYIYMYILYGFYVHVYIDLCAKSKKVVNRYLQ